MRVAVTGTPGTGKTTATDRLETDLDVIHLNRVIDDRELYTAIDDERGSVVADIDALASWLDGRDGVVIESHLAHRFQVDRVAVLRCHPEALEIRLRDRGESDAKARENAESEALDVILSEAVERHGLESVYEVETTHADPDAVATELEAVIAGERDPSAGSVDFAGYLQ